MRGGCVFNTLPLTCVRGRGSKVGILKKIDLFDVYEGKGIEDGKKSYAVNFTLQDTEKTLEDRQIDNVMNRLIKAFTEKLNATIR